MASHTDITALKNEWKILFKNWHLDGCKEGAWRCINGNQMRPERISLDAYFKTAFGPSTLGFGGTTLFFSNGVIVLAACCTNEPVYNWFGTFYKHICSTREYRAAFNIAGITASIQKGKKLDYLILEGNLDAFEHSEFYTECQKTYAERLAKKQEKEDLLQATIADVLKNKERIMAIWESPILERIQKFDKNNCFSYWDCNAYSVAKDCVYGRKAKGINWWDDSCYAFKFCFEENGYQKLGYLDCALLAVALILTRYERTPKEIEDGELKNLLIQADFECEKDQIKFIYCKPEVQSVSNLKGLLE